MTVQTQTKFRVIGQRTQKVDAIDKVTGRAQFGADVKLPRMLYGKVLRSSYAHALIKRIDTSKAEALEGVVAVITGDDLQEIATGGQGPFGSITPHDHYLSQEVIARDTILYLWQ